MKTLVTLVLAFLFWSCAVTVKTAYEPQVDFSAYKSFCWLESCEFTFSGPKYLNDTIVRRNLQRAIISEMQKKGLNYLSDNPDLLLDVHVIMETILPTFIIATMTWRSSPFPTLKKSRFVC
jgi:hypothetical protein